MTSGFRAPDTRIFHSRPLICAEYVRFRHFLDAPIRGSAQNSTQDGSWLNRCFGTGLRSTDRLIDLLDELPSERDSDGNSVGIIHASDGSLHNPAEMKRETIWRLSGPHAAADRVEVVTQRTELRRDRFRDEDFV